MARATLAFKNNYSLSVESVIRGHQVYKETWNLYKGEKLMCIHDKREKAKIFEDHAVGAYKDSCLVSYVSIELSFLFRKFIEKKNKQIVAEVNSENGLALPSIYRINENKKLIETFSEELNNLKKGKMIHMNIKISENLTKNIFVITHFWFNFCI